jgi:hypothetical protein
VPIRVSSTPQIDKLLCDLASTSAVAREAAAARLTVIGPRAVGRLIAAATADGTSSDAAKAAAAWRTLEAIGDVRALEPALQTIRTPARPAAVTVAAIGAARTFLKGSHGHAVVEALTIAALDRTRPDAVRVAALQALNDLERATLAPLLRSLAADPSLAVRDHAATKQKTRRRLGTPRAVAPEADYERILNEAADGRLGDDPAAIRVAIHNAGATIALPTLQRVVERIREREGAEPTRAAEWQLARAAAHQALADRGSRLALYDLRESLDRAAGRLAVEFLAPLNAIGDASCLEAIAAAHAAAIDAWWRQQLTRTFFLIVERERLTQRHAVLKRIGRRWPALGGARAGSSQ